MLGSLPSTNTYRIKVRITQSVLAYVDNRQVYIFQLICIQYEGI